MSNAVIDGALLKPYRASMNINQSEVLQNIIFISKLTVYFKIDNSIFFLTASIHFLFNPEIYFLLSSISKYTSSQTKFIGLFLRFGLWHC